MVALVTERTSKNVPGAVLLLVLGLAVYALSVTALAIPRSFSRIEPVWLSNAVVLAALLKRPTREWPWVLLAGLIGDTAAKLSWGDTAPVAFGLSVFDALEALICAMAVLRASKGEPDLARWDDLTAFLGSAIGASFVSAMGASAWLSVVGEGRFVVDFATWFGADALGLLIITPAALSLWRLTPGRSRRDVTVKAGVALAVVALVTMAVFTQTRYPMLFLIPPALLVLTLEAEQLGSAAGMLVVTAITIALTLADSGPLMLIHEAGVERIFIVQAFLAICSFQGLIVSALLVQRRRLRQSLARARDDAEELARRALQAEAVARVGHWRVEVATGAVTCSDEMYRIHGMDPGGPRSIGDARQLILPDDQPAAQARMEGALRDGQGWEGAIIRVVVDGDLRYLEGRAVCVRDAKGRVAEVVGTIMDITERVRSEQAILDSEARYRMLAENMTDIVVRAGRDGTLLYVSPSCRTWGYDPEELIGRNAAELVHPDDLAHFAANTSALLSGAPVDRAAIREHRYRRKDGEWVWLEGNPSVRDDAAGTPVEIINVFRDVTERHEAAAVLAEAKAAAEEAAAVKSEFLANMSHELRTPLTSILGFTGLAARQPELSEITARFVTKIADASQALLCTVNDILDFSKLEAGQVAIRPEPISPRELAQGALDLFAPQAAAKDLSLALACDLDDGFVISADPDRLRQILLNLVGNAVKFSAQGGVQLSVAWDAGRLRVQVRDTGPGLTPEAIDHLFRRFSQVDASTTRSHGGTGLGLAICKGLVDAMGGEIGVESTPGKGSTFWFSIPAPQAAEAAGQAFAQPDAAIDPGMRILVVDDHPTNRELAKLYLTGIGAEVTEATDGLEAVELAELWPFDAVLMDLAMPNLDGRGALRRVREGRLNARTPILAFTAEARPETHSTLLAEGFDGVVGKPIDASNLLFEIARATEWREPAAASDAC